MLFCVVGWHGSHIGLFPYVSCVGGCGLSLLLLILFGGEVGVFFLAPVLPVGKPHLVLVAVQGAPKQGVYN